MSTIVYNIATGKLEMACKIITPKQAAQSIKDIIKAEAKGDVELEKKLFLMFFLRYELKRLGVE